MSSADRFGDFLTTRTQSRNWSGVTVQSIEREMGPGRAWHRLPSSSTHLVSVILKEVRGSCETRTDLRQPAPAAADRPYWADGHVSIVPQGCEVWGYTDSVALVHEARLFVDPLRARETVGDDFPEHLFNSTLLMKVDRELQTLARLLAHEAWQQRSEPLYGEGLMAALLARLGAIGRQRPERGSCPSGLTPKQLRTVKDYIATRLSESIGLTELADLTGLSRSQFGRAFKSSTGMSPHRWHLEQRLDLAKRLLIDSRQSLVDVALMAGFSEQSHFNHVFRSFTGLTPTAWRRGH